MRRDKKSTIEVQGTAITVLSHKEDDYICITDIARFKNVDRTDDLVRNWLRNRNTVEFLGIWEKLNNLHFNPVEFDGIKMQAGLKAEQEAIKERLLSQSNALYQNEANLKKLHSLKTALMQDLLTGRKRVTALLKDTEVTTQ